MLGIGVLLGVRYVFQIGGQKVMEAVYCYCGSSRGWERIEPHLRVFSGSY